MKKLAITFIILPFIAACAQGPQYVYWKRIGSSPPHLANASLGAQSRLKSDFSECSIYSDMYSKAPAASRINANNYNQGRHLKASGAVPNRWYLMNRCMNSKGWAYVGASYNIPVEPNTSLDPFKGLEPQPIAPTPEEPPINENPIEAPSPPADSDLPPEPLYSPAPVNPNPGLIEESILIQ